MLWLLFSGHNNGSIKDVSKHDWNTEIGDGSKDSNGNIGRGASETAETDSSGRNMLHCVKTQFFILWNWHWNFIIITILIYSEWIWIESPMFERNDD